MDPFGTLIRYLRQSKGIGLGELADAMGVTAATVSNWELGRERPNDPQVIDLASRVWGGCSYVTTLADLWKLPMPDWASIDAARAKLPSFKSYAHDVAVGEACPCNECRYVKEG